MSQCGNEGRFRKFIRFKTMQPGHKFQSKQSALSLSRFHSLACLFKRAAALKLPRCQRAYGCPHCSYRPAREDITWPVDPQVNSGAADYQGESHRDRDQVDLNTAILFASRDDHRLAV